jgi:hypothetical protein
VYRVVQRSTESRTTRLEIELGRVLEGRHSKVIDEEITRRLHSVLN